MIGRFGHELCERWQTGLVGVIESHGRSFEVLMASDVIRDGMGLELTEITPGVVTGAPVIEVFWHDDGSAFDFMCHGAASLPFEVIERFVAMARGQLPPTTP